MNSQNSDIPVIETARTILRPHRRSDFEASLALWADMAVTRHIGGRPMTSEEVWARLLRYAGLWRMLGYGYWVVEERDSGRFLGEVGFQDVKRDIEPDFGGAPEAGWVIAPAAHGKGFASEAVAAIHEWADRNFGGKRTVCIIDPDNLPSIRVAEKFGYREVTQTTYKGSPVILFER
ncbi:GNAT family N-acetyltransferase [Pseudaminobacter soli (ex Li et al. 2025)]|uniref:GNAT family N-acetyltransferase n=1 Tax=Pseudaminobacter soli (ex Li et al. 2025) TaxID=1295366 RepID=A0A2P7RZJ7_9HYPH|nr:GNAT family N-acetyltransferase [Mesorhizobium soli]PSJ55630.1 GNAT family N-acetyltransferase [Mesorhizobium soli]